MDAGVEDKITEDARELQFALAVVRRGEAAEPIPSIGLAASATAHGTASLLLSPRLAQANLEWTADGYSTVSKPQH